MKILALDPGGTTGCASYDTEERTWKRWTHGPDAHHWALWVTLLGEWDVIVYERFMYQRRELDKGVSLNLDAVEYIGLIKLAFVKAPFNCELYEQTPAQAKNFWTDDKLKLVGLYVTSSAHERDATRHLLYWMMQHREDPEIDDYMENLIGALRGLSEAEVGSDTDEAGDRPE